VNEKTIATIALKDGGFASLDETLREAARWVELAAAQGAHLAVLPETINLLHRKNESVPLGEYALEDWQGATAVLCETAARSKISLVLPLLVRDNGILANRFYLMSRDGTSLGHYQKRAPASGERASGVASGNSNPILWEDLRIGGAICVDIFYPQVVLDPQIESGADLFVIPSYTPAGSLLDAWAVIYGVPFVLAYSPWSRILDRDGTQLAAGGYRSETLRFGFGSPALLATINFDAVTLFADHNQEKMRDIARHYGRDVRIRFNQENCLFTLESRSADISVKEIVNEFGLISRRDYFAQQDPRSHERASSTKHP
jgi:Carbon-nitrogen hydrolase